MLCPAVPHGRIDSSYRERERDLPVDVCGRTRKNPTCKDPRKRGVKTLLVSFVEISPRSVKVLPVHIQENHRPCMLADSLAGTGSTQPKSVYRSSTMPRDWKQLQGIFLFGRQHGFPPHRFLRHCFCCCRHRWFLS
jgi:hypothetical protein